MILPGDPVVGSARYREARAHLLDASLESAMKRRVVGFAKRAEHVAADLPDLGLEQSASRHRRGPDADTAGVKRGPRVERDQVRVDRDSAGREDLRRLLAREADRAHVGEDEMVVRAARGDRDATSLQDRGERPGVGHDLRRVRPEVVRSGQLEADRLGRDGVHEGPTMGSGEDRAVERPELTGSAEHKRTTRSTQGLVGRRGDVVREGHGVGMRTADDEASEVRHVTQHPGSDLTCQRGEVRHGEDTRIRAVSDDDQLRLHVASNSRGSIEVNQAGIAVHAVAERTVERTREVLRVSVREVSSVVELECEEGIAGLHGRHHHGQVGRGAAVRLDVGTLGAEELDQSVSRQLLDLIDDLAASVIAPARQAFGILVAEAGSESRQHGGVSVILRRDHLEPAALASFFLLDELRDIRIYFRDDLDSIHGREQFDGLRSD